MKKYLLIIAILCLPFAAHATTITSAQNGNWSNTATWTGGAVPGNGDSAIITKNVTVDVNTIVGTSALPVYGYVSGITTTSGGTSYTGTCSAAFTGGTSINGKAAVASCTDTAGVLSLTLTDEGLYSTVPTGITITASTGSGASFAPITIKPGGTAAIAISTAGTLTVATSTSLTVRGDIVWDGNMTFGGGTTLTFDSHLNATTTTEYRAMPSGNIEFIVASFWGLTGSHVTITSNAGGANGFFSAAGYDDSGGIIANYTDFLRCGDALHSCFEHNYDDGRPNNVINITNSTFTNGGGISRANLTGASPEDGSDNFIIDNTVFSGTLTNYAIDVAPTQDRTTGTWEIKNDYLDQALGATQSASLKQFTIENDVISGIGTQAVTPGGNTIAPWDAFSDNVVWATTTTTTLNTPITGGMTNVYWAMSSGGNIHLFNVATNVNNTVYNGLITQSLSYEGCGDADGPDLSGGAGTTISIINSIVLPCGTQASMGLNNSGLGNLATTTIEHNTYMGGPGSDNSNEVNETTQEPAGLIASLKSNLYWDVFPRVGHFSPASDGPNLLDNIANPSNITNNAAWNASTTAQINPSLPLDNGTWASKTSWNTYYEIPTTGATPGANDVNGQNPNFYDVTISNGVVTHWRDMAGWAKALHGADGTWQGALTVLQNGDRSVLIPEMLTWVRAGWAPTNPAYNGAAADGGTIGAVPYVAAPVSHGLLAKLGAVLFLLGGKLLFI